MGELTNEPAKEPLRPTPQSKELTDKIHRLVRSFSKQLTQLVYEEIGARAVKLKKKPGPKVGHKARRQKCPLCRKNENSFRRFGFICRPCRGGKKLKLTDRVKDTILPTHELAHKDALGEDFEVVVPIPEGLPLKPKDVEIEDAEPDFLDTIVKVVEVEPKKRAPAKKKPADDDEPEGFW